MRDDRAQILGQIRMSLRTAHLPAARATIVARASRTQGDRAAMIEAFRRELEPLGGTSYVAKSDEQAIELVLGVVRDLHGEQGRRDVLMWDDAELAVRGLGDAVRAAGNTQQPVELPEQREQRKSRLMELEHAMVGITGALAGIADTGTLALVSSARRPRLASLLPPVHIALLRAGDLYPDMASFFAAHPDVMRDASNLVFVTGPSRTADIELTLQRGVHGPKFLHVILLENG